MLAAAMTASTQPCCTMELLNHEKPLCSGMPTAVLLLVLLSADCARIVHFAISTGESAHTADREGESFASKGLRSTVRYR
jgi:hypothetical protein